MTSEPSGLSVIEYLKFRSNLLGFFPNMRLNRHSRALTRKKSFEHSRALNGTGSVILIAAAKRPS